jgi:EF hand
MYFQWPGALAGLNHGANCKEHAMNGAMKVAALAAVLACPVAFAEDTTTTATGNNEWPEFSTLDQNGDGNISKDEAKAQSLLASRFSEVDKDMDGKLSADEYNGARNHMKAPNP